VSIPAEDDDINTDLNEFLGIFRGLPDPRDPRGLQYDLVFIFAASTIAVMAGAAGFRAIADHIADLPTSMLKAFGARWNWFRRKYNCPSASALRSVFADIDIEELERRIGAWLFTRARRDQEGPLTLALDGKVLRGAWLDDHQQFTLFSAMIHGVGVTVGQLQVPQGTTEVTQVGPLIDMIPAAGADTLITMDAAHTHATTAQALKGERNIDFIMTAKSNQPNLLAELISRFKPVMASAPDHVMEERGHGRKKRWSLWVLPATDLDFPHLEQIACIRRDTWTLDGTYIGKEFAFPITSAPAGKVSPSDLNHHVRNHWGIEGKSHWVRDTVWREDHNQSWKGSTAHTLAALKNLAIGAMRLAGLHEIKRTTESIARDRNRAIPLLASS
jgi:predicted transposase YbfD/YdcC